jgi:hypothetical protein
MRQKEIGMNKLKATHLASVALVSLLALGGQRVAQAEPMDDHSGAMDDHSAAMDDHHGAMHGHYARHGHYGAMHDRSAMGGRYGAMHGHSAMGGHHYGAMHGRYAMGGYHGYGARYGRYAMGGYYGPRYGRYAVGGGGFAATAIPPQGYDYVGSYEGSYAPPQPNYGAGGFGQGFGLGQSRPVYVLPDGSLTSSLSDYYSRLGASSYGNGGPVGLGAANPVGGTINAATLGILGPTNAEYNPPPPAAGPETEPPPPGGHPGY